MTHYLITATYPLNIYTETATITAPTKQEAMRLARNYYRPPWRLTIKPATAPYLKAA